MPSLLYMFVAHIGESINGNFDLDESVVYYRPTAKTYAFSMREVSIYN